MIIYEYVLCCVCAFYGHSSLLFVCLCNDVSGMANRVFACVGMCRVRE